MTETPPDCDELAFDDAFEFVEALSPIHSRWGAVRGRWIFRGQADSTWSLTPSAHRTDVLNAFLRALGAFGLPPDFSQQRRELQAVLEFVQQCRASAISVPEDGQAIRSREQLELDRLGNPKAVSDVVEEDWPPRTLASLFAIAQHHGVPTRLLDWTRSPYVAAYFAARGAAEQPPGRDRHLAVWAFEHERVTSLGSVLSPSMRLIEAPADTNRYLQAQRGLFTVVSNNRRGHPPADPERLASFGEVVSYAWWYLPTMGMTVGDPWVRKLTLPQNEAGRLLQALDRFEVNAATIFPDHNGVTSALRERKFWP